MSEAQGRHREAGAEESVEQNPVDTHRIARPTDYEVHCHQGVRQSVLNSSRMTDDVARGLLAAGFGCDCLTGILKNARPPGEAAFLF
jgi:hypothetical protein